MNIVFWVILTALVLDFGIQVLSTTLNIRSLTPTAPDGLDDVYDGETYRTSQEYTQAHARFGLIVDAFKMMLLVAFWVAGGFNYIDLAVRAMGWNEISSGMAFIGIFVLVSMLFSVPLSFYRTFGIEAKFGFNKTTYLTFAVDTLKGICVSAVIGAPVLAGILYLFENMGSLSWLYAWTFVTFLSFIISFIAPVWIMPIFNKFTPLEPGELRDAIIEYARTVDFKYGDLRLET